MNKTKFTPSAMTPDIDTWSVGRQRKELAFELGLEEGVELKHWKSLPVCWNSISRGIESLTYMKQLEKDQEID